jgi:hypothetical protein
VCGDSIHFAFAVDGQQPDLVILPLEVVDYPYAAALPSSGNRPADFLNTTVAPDYHPCIGVLEQKTLQAGIFLLGQVIIDILGESSGFYEFHKSFIRQSRINVNVFWILLPKAGYEVRILCPQPGNTPFEGCFSFDFFQQGFYRKEVSIGSLWLFSICSRRLNEYSFDNLLLPAPVQEKVINPGFQYGNYYLTITVIFLFPA